jgi:predicted O-methyltransferase YrrM
MGSVEASWEYAERYVGEDAVLVAARQRADEAGCDSIGAGTGSALRLLAAAIDAKAVMELGTGTGVSGTWLLRGMRTDGVLTTVDIDAEHQRLARQTFDAAGFSGSRVRLINGAALEVLPRFADAAYDLVFVDAARGECADYLEQALRLLRPGGVVAFADALGGGKASDEAATKTQSVRKLGAALLEDDRVVPALLPVGDGLLVAVRRSAA